MIRAGYSLGWKDFARERAEAALHPVADDRTADFLGDREADAHRWIRIFPIADQQDEAWGGRTQAAIGGNEIRAFLDRD